MGAEAEDDAVVCAGAAPVVGERGDVEAMGGQCRDDELLGFVAQKYSVETAVDGAKLCIREVTEGVLDDGAAVSVKAPQTLGAAS